MTRHVPGPKRGDERREQLLAALEDLLAERPLASIGIADISRAAGVTRSGFYFYFPSKAAAVAALLADVQEEIEQAGADWYEAGDAPPLDRVESAVARSVPLWREHAHLLTAMLDGVATDAEVREIWDTWTGGFVERIAARITQDVKAGVAHASADPAALATILMGATLSAMEQDVRRIAGGTEPSDAIAGALVELWFRTLYAG